MKLRVSLIIRLVCAISAALFPADRAFAAGFDTKIFRAAAIGLVVKEASPALDKFINTFTFQQNIPVGMSTKVVPILSVGEKGYVGAAQVSGPESSVKTVQAVWLYEDNFSRNEFRLKILVPSASLNPFALKRVQKVGVSAIIDVALDGRWKGQTYSHAVHAGDILKAGVVAVAVNAAAEPLNEAINAVTKGSSSSTKVVPIATIGDKAYIGGAQVSGAAVKAIKAVYQYEEIFDGGKFRIKVFVPSNSTNPLKIKRVSGVGITALIDTSIADQERIRERERFWRTYPVRAGTIDLILADKFRHDRGLHLGWYIGRGNQRKRLTGVWADRYVQLSPDDREAFVVWWNAHHKDKPAALENRWQGWTKERKGHGKGFEVAAPSKDDDKDKDKGKSDDRGEGRGKGKGKNK